MEENCYTKDILYLPCMHSYQNCIANCDAIQEKIIPCKENVEILILKR